MNRMFPRGHNAQFDGTNYILYGSNIFHVNLDGSFTLDSYGWMTLLTKTHMNDVLEATFRPWRVYQEDFKWLVHNYKTGQHLAFYDGITIK